MMRLSRWGVGSCDCGCWILLDVTHLLASSDPPLLPLRKFPGSLSSPLSSLFSSPFSLAFPLPFSLPFSPLFLPSCSSPYCSSLPPPPPSLFSSPVPSSRSCFPILPSVPHRRQAPGLTPEAVGYLQATSPVYRDDAVCGMAVSGFLLFFFPDVVDTRALFVLPFPLHSHTVSCLQSRLCPRSRPRSRLRYRSRFRRRSCPRAHLLLALWSPPPFPFLFPPRSRSGRRSRLASIRAPQPRSIPIIITVPVPAPNLVPISIPTPDSDPAPDHIRSFPSLGPGYSLGTMHVYRHRVLRTELPGTRSAAPCLQRWWRVQNESPCCKTKENRHRGKRATSFPSVRCWGPLECIFDLCSTRLMVSSLMSVCTSESASLHVDIARGRRGKVAGNEHRYLFFFRSTASAWCFPAWITSFSRLELAQGLTMVMSSRSALFLRRGRFSKSAPASVVMSMCRGFNLRFCQLVLSRKGHVASTTNRALLSQRDRASA